MSEFAIQLIGSDGRISTCDRLKIDRGPELWRRLGNVVRGLPSPKGITVRVTDSNGGIIVQTSAIAVLTHARS